MLGTTAAAAATAASPAQRDAIKKRNPRGDLWLQLDICEKLLASFNEIVGTSVQTTDPASTEGIMGRFNSTFMQGKDCSKSFNPFDLKCLQLQLIVNLPKEHWYLQAPTMMISHWEACTSAKTQPATSLKRIPLLKFSSLRVLPLEVAESYPVNSSFSKKFVTMEISAG